MEQDGKTYLLPHPTAVRVIMTLAGAFVMLITPYELWRGVWPLNATTPFFALIMFGGMTVGAAFLQGGLLSPAVSLRFAPGSISISYEYPWGRSQRTVPAENILDFAVEEAANSDGPNDWYAVLRLTSGDHIRSRPLGTRDAAERQLAEFKAALRPESD